MASPKGETVRGHLPQAIAPHAPRHLFPAPISHPAAPASAPCVALGWADRPTPARSRRAGGGCAPHRADRRAKVAEERRFRQAEQRDDRIAAQHPDLRHRAWLCVSPAHAEPLERIEQRQRQAGRAFRHQCLGPFRQRAGPDHQAGAVAVLAIERRLLRRWLARTPRWQFHRQSLRGDDDQPACGGFGRPQQAKHETVEMARKGRGAGDSLLFSASAWP